MVRKLGKFLCSMFLFAFLAMTLNNHNLNLVLQSNLVFLFFILSREAVNIIYKLAESAWKIFFIKFEKVLSPTPRWKSQEKELELAVLDKGEYQLRPEFRHLVVTGDKWAKMINDQIKEALSLVHHIGLEEASPNSVASVNKKLVEGESAVFQQILSSFFLRTKEKNW